MDGKKRIVILGAGISGLSAAFFLGKKNPQYECLVLEKESSSGGYMETEEKQGAILEKGPHIFKVSRNQEFLKLIEEVGYFPEVIFSSKAGGKRYLWVDGEMKTVLKAVYKPLLKAFLSEWRKPAVEKEETIAEFAKRRFGVKIAQRLFDPIVLGIYGGKSDLLSVNACFPIFKRWEKEKGSVTKGVLSSLFKNKSDSGLFSFKKGVGSFIRHLEKNISCPIFFGKEATSIKKVGSQFLVFSAKEVFEADAIILAVPSYIAASLIQSIEAKVAEDLFKIPYQSITSVNVVLEKGALQKGGFGYLIPSEEQENILGVIFDSNIFPDQDPKKQTKITLMIRDCHHSEEDILNCVRRCLEKHLGIFQTPKEVVIKKMVRAIPQYVLGHRENKEAIKERLPEGIHIIGNYLDGVSVNDAIKTAKNVSIW